jgi:hypothetical protein
MADEDKTEQTRRRIRSTLDRLERHTSSESERAISSESERAESSRRKIKSIEQLEDESKIIRNL